METNTDTEQPIKLKRSDPAFWQEQTCSQCQPERQFPNMLSLQMHTNRVHNKTIRVPGQGGRQSEKERLAKRRIYQRNLRERYKRQGRDSRGYPRTSPYGLPPYAAIQNPKGAKTTRIKLKKGGQAGSQWSPEQHAKYKRTMARKRRQREKGFVLPKSKRIRFVYPDPIDSSLVPERAIPTTPGETPGVREYVRAQLMRHCPSCGHDLHQWEIKT